MSSNLKTPQDVVLLMYYFISPQVCNVNGGGGGPYDDAAARTLSAATRSPIAHIDQVLTIPRQAAANRATNREMIESVTHAGPAGSRHTPGHRVTLNP